MSLKDPYYGNTSIFELYDFSAVNPDFSSSLSELNLLICKLEKKKIIGIAPKNLDNRSIDRWRHVTSYTERRLSKKLKVCVLAVELRVDPSEWIRLQTISRPSF